MYAKEVVTNIFYVGVDDKKRNLFEATWPIPNGISYNAYLIKDEFNALIEGGVEINYSREFFRKLESIINLEDLDYIVINHMEPDHTGTLPQLYRLAKNAKIIISPKGKELLSDFYLISNAERVITVKEGDVIELGKRRLRFISTPFLHWPETMMTYEESSKILFSGDVFGSFGALNGRLFDSNWVIDEYVMELKRYYTNIVGLFTGPTQNALKKLRNLDIDLIAPAHGPIIREYKDKVLSLYDKLSRYESENKVTVIYGTMYGYTEELVSVLALRLYEEDIPVSIFNASEIHPSYIISDAWDSKIIVLAAPTYDGKYFLPAYNVMYYIYAKRLRNKKFAVMGSSGWSGKGYLRIIDLAKELGWELIEPIVEYRGAIDRNEIKLVDELVDNIVSVLK